MANRLDFSTSTFQLGEIGHWVLTVGHTAYWTLTAELYAPTQYALVLRNLDVNRSGVSFQIPWDLSKAAIMDPVTEHRLSLDMYVPNGSVDYTYFVGYEWFDASFAPISASFPLIGPASWSGWHTLSVDFTPPFFARYGALFVQETHSAMSAPFWEVDDYRMFDNFYFGPVDPPVTGTSTPPSLRQRQNPRRVNPSN